MNAKMTILTHFSQRYPKISKFSDKICAEDSMDKKEIFERTAIAFDHMEVSIY